MYIPIIIISLLYNSIILATEHNQENHHQYNQDNIIIDIDNESAKPYKVKPSINNNTELLSLSEKRQSSKKILLDVLTQELNKNDFNRINGNYILCKLLIFVLAVSACGSDDLLITNGKQITIDIILATQMGVAVNTESMYAVIDNFMLAIKPSIVAICKQALQHKLRLVFIISKISGAVTLGYLASVIEIDSSGDGYRWLLSHATSNNKLLNIAYYYGYYAHLLFALNLYSVFFYELIDSLLAKTGIGYLFNLSPLPTENFNMLEMETHVNNMLAMANKNDLSSSTDNIAHYIKSNNLNSSFYIADMQSILTDTSVTFSKKYNLFTNLAKIAFICATTAFCGIAFKQVFAARLLLKDFVNEVGNHTDGRIFFHLKNGTEISCANTADCINTLDFATIAINKQRIHEVLSSDYQAILSGILGGISISSETAAIILDTIDSIIKLAKNNLYKQALKIAYFKNNNCLPYVFCITAIPPLYYGLKNIVDTYDTADNYDRLLASMGEYQLLTTKQAIVITVTSTAITIGYYVPFLANIPRAITYIIMKIFHPLH